jgi:SAM-dependent methyltransferase
MTSKARFAVKRVLAQLSLWWAVKLAVFARTLAATARDNRSFQRLHPTESLPPLRLMMDAQGTTSYRWYFDTGVAHARELIELFRRYYVSNGTRPVVVFEWGCGPGRIIRHLRTTPIFGGAGTTLIGSDYNPASVRWCAENLPGIRFFVNHALPPLDLADQSVDILYARSVFTHLEDDACRAWLRELRRVVRPGGLVIFSTGGAGFKRRFDGDAVARFDRGEPVYLRHDRMGKRDFFAWHPPSYVRRAFLDGLEEVAFFDSTDPKNNQDLWVCRVATTSPSLPSVTAVPRAVSAAQR